MACPEAQIPRNVRGVAMIELESMDVFQTYIYKVKRPDFLPALKGISAKYFSPSANPACGSEVYPVTQTGSFFNEPEAKDFCDFIYESSMSILDHQGYAMGSHSLSFQDLWFQEHRVGSGHDRHVHSGSAISGFYFMNGMPNSSVAVFYDPRPAKEYGVNLPLKDVSRLTSGSNAMNIVPEAGMFVFANSWMHHAFTRNESSEPLVFVHFDLAAVPADPQNGVIII